MGQLYKVAKKKDIAPGKAIAVTVGNRQIAVFSLGSEYYAIDDACSHASGPLSEGDIDGTTVVCPWHGACFEIKTGKVLSEPASSDLKSYKVIVQGDDIHLDI